MRISKGPAQITGRKMKKVRRFERATLTLARQRYSFLMLLDKGSSLSPVPWCVLTPRNHRHQRHLKLFSLFIPTFFRIVVIQDFRGFGVLLLSRHFRGRIHRAKCWMERVCGVEWEWDWGGIPYISYTGVFGNNHGMVNTYSQVLQYADCVLNFTCHTILHDEPYRSSP